MSRYEWEHGTIILPSAAVAPLKKSLRDTGNKLHNAVLAECRAWWAKNKTQSLDRYRQRLEESSYNVVQAWQGGQRLRVPREQVALKYEESLRALQKIQFDSQFDGKPLRQVQVADLNRIAPRYTNRDTVFHCGEADIVFNDRNVIWTVSENNHAVDRAREHLLAKKFFQELKKVKWTRGSGGVIVGNDEYNEESLDIGGGGNYITATYGPKGSQTLRMG